MKKFGLKKFDSQILEKTEFIHSFDEAHRRKYILNPYFNSHFNPEASTNLEFFGINLFIFRYN